jgi:hypothetical protein
MNTEALVTLDSILLSVQVALIMIIAWVVQRYIKRDDEWKRHVDKKLEELTAVRAGCIQEFASKNSMNEAFKEIREHEGRISALESWRETRSGQ